MAIWLQIARASAAANSTEAPPSRLVCQATEDGEAFEIDDEDGPGCPCCRFR